MKFVPLSSFILGKNADSNKNIGNGDQNRKENGKKTWIEK